MDNLCNNKKPFTFNMGILYFSVDSNRENDIYLFFSHWRRAIFYPWPQLTSVRLSQKDPNNPIPMIALFDMLLSSIHVPEYQYFLPCKIVFAAPLTEADILQSKWIWLIILCLKCIPYPIHCFRNYITYFKLTWTERWWLGFLIAYRMSVWKLHIFIFLSRTNQTCRIHPWVNGIRISSNEGPIYFTRGDNSWKVKIHWQNTSDSIKKNPQNTLL